MSQIYHKLNGLFNERVTFAMMKKQYNCLYEKRLDNEL